MIFLCFNNEFGMKVKFLGISYILILFFLSSTNAIAEGVPHGSLSIDFSKKSPVLVASEHNNWEAFGTDKEKFYYYGIDLQNWKLGGKLTKNEYDKLSLSQIKSKKRNPLKMESKLFFQMTAQNLLLNTLTAKTQVVGG